MVHLLQLPPVSLSPVFMFEGGRSGHMRLICGLDNSFDRAKYHPQQPDQACYTKQLLAKPLLLRPVGVKVFFRVQDLELRAGRFDVELPAGAIEFLDPKLHQVGPLRAAGKVELVIGSLGEIRVQGHVAVAMQADCDRCLEPASCPIDSDFELYYRPVADGYGEEKALDPGEVEMGFYDGDGIELNDVLLEYVLLALPMQRLCSESCKGICPVCGQNRNQNECGCRSGAVDDRWAALKELSK